MLSCSEFFNSLWTNLWWLFLFGYLRWYGWQWKRILVWSTSPTKHHSSFSNKPSYSSNLNIIPEEWNPRNHNSPSHQQSALTPIDSKHFQPTPGILVHFYEPTSILPLFLSILKKITIYYGSTISNFNLEPYSTSQPVLELTVSFRFEYWLPSPLLYFDLSFKELYAQLWT